MDKPKYLYNVGYKVPKSWITGYDKSLHVKFLLNLCSFKDSFLQDMKYIYIVANSIIKIIIPHLNKKVIFWPFLTAPSSLLSLLK